MEDWEYMLQYGEAHKQLTSAKPLSSKKTLAMPQSARAKPTKKLGVKRDVKIADFRAPVSSRRSLA